MNIQLLRHAAQVVHYASKTILVDPMLSRAGVRDPIANTPNPQRNPMVELPLSDEQLDQLLQTVDAVLVTHTHGDHWDARAAELIPKGVTLLCQPADITRFQNEGFTNVQTVSDGLEWEGIHFFRTGGQHGTGEVGQRMGTVSGFVLRAEAEPTLYISGDTIWCAEVEDAITRYQPDVVVVFAGEAQFLAGGPITMSADDVIKVCQTLPNAQVIAIHMETMNHCLLTRAALRDCLTSAGCGDRVSIPANGETVLC